MNTTRDIQRLWTIIVNGASRIISSLSTSVVSLVVIQTQSEEVWGSAVQWVLVFDLAFSVISWGSSPYLLREFSLDPKSISTQWSTSTLARLPLLGLFVVVLIMMPAATLLKVSMLVWALTRYLYQSYEPILQFHRNFTFSFVLELTSLFVTLVPMFTIRSEVTGELVVIMIAAGMAWKSLVTTCWVLWLRRIVTPGWATQSATAWLAAAFPFLMLTFSAMLQQRMDLYIVAYFLDERETAIYQVFVNWLIFCQFLAALLLSPFAKNIFRVSTIVFRKLESRFMMSGLYLSLLSILGVYLVISQLYQFDLPPWYYAIGYAQILVFYFYGLKNYQLGKMLKQSTVVVYSLLSSLVNFVLSLVLIPSLAMSGALIASVLAQLFLLGLYHLRKSAYAGG